MIRFLRATRSVALTLAFVAAIIAPTLALDRVQFLYGMNPPSSWFNQGTRAVRLGTGQWMFNALGSGNSYFSNLSVTPGTGLNVSVGPTSSNTLASLYQYLADDTSPFGGPGATALPVDNTQIELQGLMTPSQALTIGPLNPPGTSGQSIIYAIECQVRTVDTTSQTVNFVSSSGTVTSGSANRDRADQIWCQSKAGTASGSPSAPSIDTGYVGVANVTVAYGASSISSGNIAMTTANGLYGFLRLASLGVSASLPLCSDANSKATTSGCNIPVSNGTVAASSPLCTDASSKITTSGCVTVSVLNASGSGQTGVKMILVSGVAPASSSNTCGPYSGLNYCATISLTGNAQFSSGGTTSSPPSFSCGSGFVYANSGNYANAYAGTPSNQAGGGGVAITVGAPNTIYVNLGSASLPFTFTCVGT